MSRRDHWIFGYTATELAAAARAREAYHAQHFATWRDEAAKIEKQIERGGVEVRRRQITGGVRREVVIDAELEHRLTEAEAKRDEHERRLHVYRRFAQGFERAPAETHYALDVDDLAFFDL